MLHKSSTRTVERDAKPLLNLPIAVITVADVRRCVEPIWRRGHHEAARLSLARIAKVIDHAIAMRWRPTPNPADREVFKAIAPARPKATIACGRFPWAAAPEVVARLRDSRSMSSLVLEFLILTGTRMSEVTHAAFDEFDLDKALWTIPRAGGTRGTRVSHVVALSERAVEIVRAASPRHPWGRRKLVFSGAPPGSGLSRTTVSEQCERMTAGRACPHGFQIDLSHMDGRPRRPAGRRGIFASAMD